MEWIVVLALMAQAPGLSPDRLDINGDGLFDPQDILAVSQQWKTNSTLIRYPYVQNTTTSSLEIAWRTQESAPSLIEFGTGDDSSEVFTSSLVGNIQWRRFENLSSETSYRYRILSASGAALTEFETAQTFPTVDSTLDVSFAVLGDSGHPTDSNGNSTCSLGRFGGVASPPQSAVALMMESVQPDLMIHTGDVIYCRGEDELFDPLFFQPYRNLLARIPSYPCLGNHDLQTANGGPYLANFFLPGNGTAEEVNERYYSFDYGNAHFICLDSNRIAGPNPPTDSGCVSVACQDQLDWLESDLAASASAEWKIVFFHHSPYTTGIHLFDGSAGNRAVNGFRDFWIPLFEQHGVDVVFTGHDHHYERTYPLLGGRPNFDLGIVYVVTGGGGRPLRRVLPYTSCLSSHLRAAYIEDTRHHFVHATIQGPLMILEAIDSEGKVFDTSFITHEPIEDCISH